MAYKFNNGCGAVVCDHCGLIIDANISLKDYEEIYETPNPTGVYCWRCNKGIKTKTVYAQFWEDKSRVGGWDTYG